MTTKIGTIIKNLRLANNESQNDLANALNISFQSVSKWENGLSYPDILILKEIANHYQVSIDFLLGNEKMKENSKEYTYAITKNQESSFSVFTDTNENPNISILDASRHRGPSKIKYRASDDEKKTILAINQEGKLIYAGKKLGYGYATPSDDTYHDGSSSLSNCECFLIEKNFVFYKNRLDKQALKYYPKTNHFFETSFNEESSFSVFTDFVINETIAPVALTNKNYHRSIANESYRASNNKEDIIIAINEEGQIIYMSNYSGFSYGSPCDCFYTNKFIDGINVECFLLKSDYLTFAETPFRKTNYLSYEFVIPKNGLIIVGNMQNQSFCQFMKILLSQHFSYAKVNNPNFYKTLKSGCLNDKIIKIINNQLCIETIQYEDLHLNYEFVVPKGGFIILGNLNYYPFYQFCRNLFPDMSESEFKEIDSYNNNSLFESCALKGQFNEYHFSLKENRLNVKRPLNEEELILSQSNNLDLDKLTNIMEKRILKRLKNDDLTDRLNELESQIEELDSQIDELDSQIEELDSQIDELESQIDELNN